MKPIPLLQFLLAIIFMHEALPQHNQQNHSCMFYNVENLFHPSDDPHEGDNDFTPEGERRWTFYRYNIKIIEICKVILAVNPWEPPAFICLSEIENRKVLKDIIYHPLLVNYPYEFLHRDSRDHRGMDVAILYRTDQATCIDTSWIIFRDAGGKPMPLREVLTAKFLINSDTLMIAVNHWISKYGGSQETESKRILQAETVGQFIDSVVASQPKIAVIAGGDLNDVAGSAPLQILEDNYLLHRIHPPEGQSSYKYEGRWASVDHIFISGSLIASNSWATIPNNTFLLENDEKYTGLRPRRTYRGYAYNGGISDHLPLLLIFHMPQ